MKWNVLATMTAVVIFSAAANADVAGQLDACKDEETPATDRIQACTQLIDSNSLPAALGDIYRERGNAYADRDQYDLAVADETKAISINAKDAAAFNIRAWSRLKQGDAKQALEDANQALSLNPQLVDALDTRARTYENLGKKDDALADYKKALAINPGHEDSKDAMARLAGR
jgi:tetratricopeptide (TPR) repeat protein